MYVIPMILGNIFYSEMIKYYPVYRIEPLSLRFFISLIGTLACFFLFYQIRFPPFLSRIRQTHSLIRLFSLSYNSIRPYFIIVSFLIGLFSLYTQASSFRYGSVSLVSSSQFILIVFNMLCYSILTLDIFYTIFIKGSDINETNSDKKLDVLCSLAYISLSNGITTIFLGCLAFLFITFSNLKSLLFVKNVISLRAILRLIFFICIVFYLVEHSDRLGSRIKHKSLYSSETISYQRSGDDFIPNCIGRISSYYDTLLYTSSSKFSDNLYTGYFSPSMLLSSMYYRLSKLFPFILSQVDKNQISSFSRLNYLNLSTTRSHSREGTSPGIISSFDYVFFFPLSIIVCSLYLCFISKMIDRLTFDENRKISLIGAFIVFTLLASFFQSPFDLLCIFDNVSIMSFGFYLMSLGDFSHKKTGESLCMAQ